MTVLVFDIETIPDIENAKKIHQLESLNDEEALSALLALRRAKSGHEFFPLHLQKIVAISLVMSTSSQIKVWSLGTEQSDEKELITRFFAGLEKHIPTLVSWNGAGFDLPVLHYRALLHGISAPAYWELGDNNQAFRWNNYLNRFHMRHVDLMDILAGYQNKAFAPLDEIASMLGFPGKMGMHGSLVHQAWLNGEIQAIRNYCETDVLNTWGVFMRFELMRGNINLEEYHQQIQKLKQYLLAENKPHLQEFLEKMPGSVDISLA